MIELLELFTRFEMPYNIWCGGCGIHIGMGMFVREVKLAFDNSTACLKSLYRENMLLKGAFI